MDPQKETYETWNKIASLYEEKFMNLDLYNETYDHFCNSITKDGASILDIGCGPGNITKYLLSKRPDFDILGIDLAPNMIELARKNNPEAGFEVMDCRHISDLSQTFDGIIVGFCLPFISPSETDKFISDSYNKLAEQGFIYLSFVDGPPEQSGFKEGSSGDRIYFNFHELDKLKSLLIDKGLEDLQTFLVKFKTDTHTIITARKKQKQ
jgi:cyclopropane fatty-acyl-phospholipid synthase-like methyltransferase